eukprot:gene17045-26151_t
MGCLSTRDACENDTPIHATLPMLTLCGQNLHRLPVVINPCIVTHLNLSLNRFTSLPPDFCEGWDRLEEVNLADNRLTEVPVALTFLPRLTSLVISGNPLRIPKALDILRLSRLSSISLSRLNLSEVPDVLREVPSLTRLDLSGNYDIDLEGVRRLKLEALNVANCGLMAVPAAICASVSLESLTLSGNPELNVASLVRLECLPSLRVLECKNMMWPMLPQNLVQLRLESADFGGNRLTSLKGLDRLAFLQSIGLSYGTLKQVPLQLAALAKLRKVDLEGNQLDTLIGLKACDGIEELIISQNKVCRSSATNQIWRDVASLRSLRKLTFKRWGRTEHRNANPYCTKIPAPLFVLPRLEEINGIPLPKPFTANMGVNMVTVLQNGYFKLDLSLDLEARFKYHVKLLARFFAFRGALRSDVPRSVQRYKIFLFLQNRFRHTVKLVAPLDVTLLHYIHMTRPASYHADCSRIFNSIVHCYYHGIDRSSAALPQHERFIFSKNLWETHFGQGSFSFPLPDDEDRMPGVPLPTTSGSLSEWFTESKISDDGSPRATLAALSSAALNTRGSASDAASSAFLLHDADESAMHLSSSDESARSTQYSCVSSPASGRDFRRGIPKRLPADALVDLIDEATRSGYSGVGPYVLRKVESYTFSVDFAVEVPEALLHAELVTSKKDFYLERADAAVLRFHKFLALEALRHYFLPQTAVFQLGVPSGSYHSPQSGGSSDRHFGKHHIVTPASHPPDSSDNSEDDKNDDRLPPGYLPEVDGVDMTKPLAPSPGIELVLHAYQCLPQGMYHSFSCGRVADFNMRIGVDGDLVKYQEAMHHTKKLWTSLWKEAYFEPSDTPGNQDSEGESNGTSVTSEDSGRSVENPPLASTMPVMPAKSQCQSKDTVVDNSEDGFFNLVNHDHIPRHSSPAQCCEVSATRLRSSLSSAHRGVSATRLRSSMKSQVLSLRCGSSDSFVRCVSEGSVRFVEHPGI